MSGIPPPHLIDQASYVRSTIAAFLGPKISSLIEKYHLYQSMQIDMQEMVRHCRQHTSLDPSRIQEHLEEIGSASWSIYNPDKDGYPTGLSIGIRGAELYCKTCRKGIPTNLIESHKLEFPSRHSYEIYTLVFMCQGCRESTITIMIERVCYKLIVSGRAPIEEVQVPKEIPGRIRKYYSGAVIARNAGQVLAGNFLLRCLIEQYVRLFAPEERVDDCLSAYAATLPDDFKSRFPSLTTPYGDLSVDIHCAKGSAKVFEEAISLIDKHFDAKRVCEIPNTPPVVGTDSN
jgi:hypothetical protein